MKDHKAILLAGALFLFTGAVSPASGEKELIIKLQGEVIVLQRQVRDLQEFLDKWQARSLDTLNKISNDVDATSRGMSALDESIKTSQLSIRNSNTGASSQLSKIAEQLIQNNQQTEQVRRRIEALQQAVQDYQNKIEAKEKTGLTTDPSTLNDPDQLFTSAYVQFTKKNYTTAIDLFNTYLRLHSDTERADDALFWIAESSFEQARYDEALRGYERLTSSYPKGDKAPSSHFKRGVSLLRLERREEGVNALKAFLRTYPEAVEATSAREELNRLGESAPGSAPTSSPYRSSN